MFSCSDFGPTNDPKTMSKRLMHEEQPGEEGRAVAKSKTNDEISVEDCRTVSKSTGFECTSQPGRSKHTVRIQTVPRTGTGRPVARSLNENTASSSQVWLSAAYW